MTPDLDSKTYQIDVPAFLWEPFTQEVAADYGRYNDRVVAHVAEDVLAHCPDELSETEERLAEEIAAEVADGF